MCRVSSWTLNRLVINMACILTTVLIKQTLPQSLVRGIGGRAPEAHEACDVPQRARTTVSVAL